MQIPQHSALTITLDCHSLNKVVFKVTKLNFSIENKYFEENKNLYKIFLVRKIRFQNSRIIFREGKLLERR